MNIPAGTILIPQDVAESGKAYLRERGYRIRMGSGIDRSTLLRELQGCDAVLVRTAVISEEILASEPRLRVVAKHGIGVDNIDVQAAEKLGIYVTNAPMSNAGTVAEHTLGLMIALARNLVRVDTAVRQGDFAIRDRLSCIDLEGKTLGILGMGRIGTLTAYKAIHGLGMKAIGYDPYAGDSPNSEIQRCHNIEEVFRAADFLSLHLPYTPETHHLVDARKLAWMKPSAFVVSVSRGGVVDETALIQALREGRISGAALDVFEQEPPDAENPLLRMGQVIVTPHSAALTRESTDRMSLHAAMSIHEVLAGETPAWAVNRPLLPRGASDSEL